MSSVRLVRSGALVTALVAIVSAATPAPYAAAGSQSFTALVTVVADSGSPAADLTAADLVMREKGRQLEVTRVDRVHQVPLFVSILFDISKPPMGTIPPIRDMRTALASFVEKVRAANPGAQIALTEVAGAPVPSVTFEAPPEDLDKAVSRIFIGQHSEAAMVEGLLDAAKTLKGKSAMRKVILLVDFGSHDPGRIATANEALREIQDALASVWSVSVRPANAQSSRRDAAIKAAVESTGGVRLTAVSATGLTSLLDTAANSLASQYLVTFARSASSPLDIADLTAETKQDQKVLIASLMR